MDPETVTETIDNRETRIVILDNNGYERNDPITQAYLAKVDAITVVYDVSDERSLHKARLWMQLFPQSARPGVVVMLLGNKIDLESERVGTTATLNMHRIYFDLCCSLIRFLAEGESRAGRSASLRVQKFREASLKGLRRRDRM